MYEARANPLIEQQYILFSAVLTEVQIVAPRRIPSMFASVKPPLASGSSGSRSDYRNVSGELRSRIGPKPAGDASSIKGDRCAGD